MTFFAAGVRLLHKHVGRAVQRLIGCGNAATSVPGANAYGSTFGIVMIRRKVEGGTEGLAVDTALGTSMDRTCKAP